MHEYDWNSWSYFNFGAGAGFVWAQKASGARTAVGHTLKEFKNATRGLTRDDDEEEEAKPKDQQQQAKTAVVTEKDAFDREKMEREIRERLERERLEKEIREKLEQERLQAENAQHKA